MHSDIFVTPGFHDKPGKVKMCEDSAVQEKNKDGVSGSSPDRPIIFKGD